LQVGDGEAAMNRRMDPKKIRYGHDVARDVRKIKFPSQFSKRGGAMAPRTW